MLARAFASNWPDKVSQLAPPVQPRLIPKCRHEIATMPFHPADFIVRKFTLPTRRRFRANLGDLNPGRLVTAPETSQLCGGENRLRIKGGLQITANLLH